MVAENGTARPAIWRFVLGRIIERGARVLAFFSRHKKRIEVLGIIVGMIPPFLGGISYLSGAQDRQIARYSVMWPLVYADPGSNSARRTVLELFAKEGVEIRSLYLRTVDLSSIDMFGALLPYTAIENSNLYGANFGNADFGGGSLKCTTLFETDFRGANLENVDFSGANISRAKFGDAPPRSMTNELKARFYPTLKPKGNGQPSDFRHIEHACLVRDDDDGNAIPPALPVGLDPELAARLSDLPSCRPVNSQKFRDCGYPPLQGGSGEGR